ncbi:hypothetical protein PC116_g15793 [Phytophthora cactorum]|nr:hypothetical protein PC116_g15793 [Phytophthora cactorum]
MKFSSFPALLTTTVALLLVATPATVNAHGQMTKPTPRPISQQYRADCGALSQAGDQELQYAPVELLSSRAQSDRPAAATFNIMNGCRGTVYETNNTVTELAADTPFDVQWVIQAPHPGTMVLSIVKPSTDSSSTITYESVAELLTIDPFAENSNDKTSTTATIPTSLTGCGSPGDCALQFYWHSDLARDHTGHCCCTLLLFNAIMAAITTSILQSPRDDNMKPAIFCTLAGTAIMLANTVDAHGQMLVPSYRPITAKYREDCLFGLKGAGDDELQWAPIENLSQRGQADQPVAATFNIYNGCRGLVYESENNVTEIEAGKEFDVKYYIQATHPGYMELSIVKPSTDATGKITYNRDTQIEYFSDFANTAGTFSVTATIPTNVTGCENAGDCALQFYWHSDIANQTYPTCADITIPGSGAGSSSKTSTSASTTTTSSSSSASTVPTATTATHTTTTAPSTTTTDDSKAAGEASYTADSTDASADDTTTDASAETAADASSDDTATSTTTDASSEGATPTPTNAPEATTAPDATPASDKCSVRRRRLMRQ